MDVELRFPTAYGIVTDRGDREAPDTLRGVLSLRGEVAEVFPDSVRVRIQQVDVGRGWYAPFSVNTTTIALDDGMQVLDRQHIPANRGTRALILTGLGAALLVIWVYFRAAAGH